VAAETEVTIACVGLSQILEGEEGESILSRHFGDREEVRLPQSQIDYIKKMRENAETLVVVMTGGSAIACPEIYEMADALIFVWYPGEQGGLAVGNTLFGKNVPSGKLPVTFPKSLEDLPAYDNYDMTNRTYRYMENEPLFPFGFGLSYTQFEYSGLSLSSESISAGDGVTARVSVTNQGDMAAEEVVQLYVTDEEASVPVPKYALKAFQRVALEPGESKEVEFEVKPADLEIVDFAGKRVLEPGAFTISVGGSVPSQRSLDLGAPRYLQAELVVK
jgi:beta-glucosidase